MKDKLYFILASLLQLFYRFDDFTAEKEIDSFTTEDELKSNKRNRVLSILPRNSIDQFPWIKEITGNRFGTEKYFHILNATIFGPKGLIGKEKKIFLFSVNYSKVYYHKIMGYKSLLTSLFLRHQNKIEKAISLVHLFSENYYHWVNDVMPHIRLFKELKPKNPDLRLILERFPEDSFQIQFLHLFGIEKRDLVVYEGTKLKVNNLFLSWLENDSKSNIILLNRGYFKFINKNLTQEPAIPFRRIFISRKSESRSITNEKDILRLLTPLNFEKVIPENLTVAEQIKLFHESKVVIGSHGAGLTNLAFCQPETTVIEFYPKSRPTHHASCYLQISGFFELNHYLVLCEDDEEKIEVDHMVLMDLIETALSHE